MAEVQLFGADTSPYSQKVRAFLAYKGIAFEWIQRSRTTDEAFNALAKAPSVPLLVRAGQPSLQDSSAILALIETETPQPPATPDDPVCAALALVLEDFGDEWLNKCMFQQRWGLLPDKMNAAQRTLSLILDGKRPRAWKAPAQQIAERMAARLGLVGAQPENGETLQASYRRFALKLNAHLQNRLYIFGGRPSFADFSIAAQFQQMLTDPTPGEWLRAQAPFVAAWCEHMADPKPAGDFETLESLEASLKSLFTGELARIYLPWASANAASADRARGRFSVTLSDGLFEQATQRYAARSFRGVRRSVQRLKDEPRMAAFLTATDTADYLLSDVA